MFGLTKKDSKKEGLKKISTKFQQLGLTVVEFTDKPWGGSFRFADQDFPLFKKLFYADYDLPGGNLSPKSLAFTPNSRLSWQVHQRRWELWKVLEGPVGMHLGPTDERPEDFSIYQVGEIIKMGPGTRHQNAKVDNWGVVAEIWVHTDPQNPSDENDIRRIADDYGR